MLKYDGQFYKESSKLALRELCRAIKRNGGPVIPYLDPNAKELFLAVEGITWEEPTTAPPLSPEELLNIERQGMEVTRRQGRKMLVREGFREAVEAYIATLPEQDQIDYADASKFKRTHRLVVNVIAEVCQKTPEELDEWFRQAPILYP
jgi:hypothetical protein